MEEGQNPISEHEQRELERKQREEARAAEIAHIESSKNIKRAVKWAIVLLVVGGIVWRGYSSYKNRPQPYVTSPVHWHPVLKIVIDGVEQIIPVNLGIGARYKSSPFWDPMMSMTGIHTHDSSGTLHWEIMKAPLEKDLYLGNFFQIWRKTFNSTCIFDTCNQGNKTVKMYVNGQENFDYDHYVINDKDEIQIVYGQ